MISSRGTFCWWPATLTEFEILGVLGGILASLDRYGLLADIGKSMAMIGATSYVDLVGWKEMNHEIDC